MSCLDDRATRLVHIVTEGLAVGQGRSLDNSLRTWPPLVVERLDADVYNCCHYRLHVAHFDAAPKPEAVLIRSPRNIWRLLSLTPPRTPVLGLRRLEVDAALEKSLADKRLDVAFVNFWLGHLIPEQHGRWQGIQVAVDRIRSVSSHR